MSPLGIAMMVALGLLVGGGLGCMLVAFAAVYGHPDRVDPSKPNHGFHDALGDPATCRGDHNHFGAGRQLKHYVYTARLLFATAVIGLIALVVMSGIALVQLVT